MPDAYGGREERAIAVVRFPSPGSLYIDIHPHVPGEDGLEDGTGAFVIGLRNTEDGSPSPGEIAQVTLAAQS